MRRRLNCYSFHSVKGGVGKSTLAVLLARSVAQDMPVFLVDMDLTGTSLSDVLPLEAPRWSSTVDVTRAPDGGFYDRTQTRALVHERNIAPPAELAEPLFLNDFLLHSPAGLEAANDMHPNAIGWRMPPSGPEQLLVLPSSALPRELERIMPVISDEEHAAFIEGRLEYLLDGMARAIDATTSDIAVVFDTPPGIPGLSRAVLSLALRLGRDPKAPLASDGFIPAALEAAEVTWTIFLVVTMDIQDLRAANRWLELVGDDENGLFRVVVNRAPPGALAPLDELVAEEASPALLRLPKLPISIPDDPLLRFFGTEQVPPELAAIVALLRG